MKLLIKVLIIMNFINNLINLDNNKWHQKIKKMLILVISCN